MSAVTRWIVAGVLCGLLVPPKWCCLQSSACSACCRTVSPAGLVPPSPRRSCCQTHSHGTEPSAAESTASGCGSGGGRSNLPPAPLFPGGCCEPRLLVPVSPPVPRTGLDPFYVEWLGESVRPWLSTEGARSIELSVWELPPLDTQILYGRWRN